MRFLKAGFMESNHYENTSLGTQQGGLISPVLANVYLHYVLDLWFEKCIKRQLKGEYYLVRYADDFIIMTENENEAQIVYKALKGRMARFCLELAENKTRSLPFCRNSKVKETFDFLGFLHGNGQTRTGRYTAGHLVSRKKLFKAKLKKWVKENCNAKFKWFMDRLNRKMIGTNSYYSMSKAIREVRGLFNHAFLVVYKWMNRQRQRRIFTIEKFKEVWKAKIMKPYIHVNIWG